MKLVSMLVTDDGQVLEQAVRESIPESEGYEKFANTLVGGMRQVFYQDTDGKFKGEYQMFVPSESRR